VEGSTQWAHSASVRRHAARSDGLCSPSGSTGKDRAPAACGRAALTVARPPLQAARPVPAINNHLRRIAHDDSGCFEFDLGREPHGPLAVLLFRNCGRATAGRGRIGCSGMGGPKDVAASQSGKVAVSSGNGSVTDADIDVTNGTGAPPGGLVGRRLQT